MAKWASASVLDGGLNYIKNNCIILRLVSTYTVGDSLATVIANTISSVAMVSTDFTISGSVDLRCMQHIVVCLKDSLLF